MIDPELKKNCDAALKIIIRNCRMRYPKPLARAIAYEQLEGLIIGRGFATTSTT